jgi:hypothetical protein
MLNIKDAMKYLTKYSQNFFLTSEILSTKNTFNPLTPELNPSARRCLPRFFYWGLHFLKGVLSDVFVSCSALKG